MMMNIPFVRLAWLDFLIFPIIHTLHSTIVYSTYRIYCTVLVYSTYIQNILYYTSVQYVYTEYTVLY